MMNSVRAHAFETIQHILNEGAYSNLKLMKFYLPISSLMLIGIYLLSLFAEQLNENIHWIIF